MTKDQLYDKLMSAYKRHQSKNTLCKTYTDQVIKLVKEYLVDEKIQFEVDDLKTPPGTVKVMK